ncbi:MAG: OmpA family protein [Saprospiraceae bacterium]
MMETQLRSRDVELQRLEARGATPMDYNAIPDAQYQELRRQKAAVNQQRDAMVAYLQRVLVGFPNEEVAITTTASGLTLTLSESLLFPQGDNGSVYWKGRQALQQIAVVLRDYPNLPIDIIGHTNPSSNEDIDWETSIFRSMAVAKELTSFGLDTGRVTASGRGSNHPVVPATNSRAQIVNGRTVIDIPLDFTAILQSLD